VSEYADDYFADVVHAGGHIDTEEWAEENVNVDDLDWDEIIDGAESRLMETHESVSLNSSSNIREVLSELARADLAQEAAAELESEVGDLDLESADEVSDSEPDGKYIGKHPDDDDLRCYIRPWGVWRHVDKYGVWLNFTSEHEEPAGAALRDIAEG
jgi:hypothetical protein